VIISRTGRAPLTLRDSGVRSAGQSLARRGFFHSETEAVDHLVLSPGARIDGRGREGTEEIWFVVSGGGRLVGPDGSTLPLRRNALAVCPLDSGAVLHAGPDGLTALLIAVVPPGLTGAMPIRFPAGG
jgi:mannose-6-phosphate isomerase-like protein (cupin superfamily)